MQSRWCAVAGARSRSIPTRSTVAEAVAIGACGAVSLDVGSSRGASLAFRTCSESSATVALRRLCRGRDCGMDAQSNQSSTASRRRCPLDRRGRRNDLGSRMAEASLPLSRTPGGWCAARCGIERRRRGNDRFTATAKRGSGALRGNRQLGRGCDDVRASYVQVAQFPSFTGTDGGWGFDHRGLGRVQRAPGASV